MWAVQTDGNSASYRDPGCTVSQPDGQTVGQPARLPANQLRIFTQGDCFRGLGEV